MSERTRTALGDARSIVDAVAAEISAESFEGKLPAITVRFRRLLETPERVWLSAQPNRPPDTAAKQEAFEWYDLQSSMMSHYLRLELVERRLAACVQQERRGAGRAAIRQIERERSRLSTELHTGVGQMLAAIRMQLEVISRALPDPPAPVEQALDRISVLAGEALEQARAISKRLHPPEWQRLPLSAALQQLWDLSGIPERFNAFLQIQPLARDPDPEVKALLYRAAQEALSNLARHSHATQIRAALEAPNERLVLTIEDNGVGFDAAALLSAPASLTAGIGLRSIREQAAALGGELGIDSGPSGTKLTVTVPFSPPDD